MSMDMATPERKTTDHLMIEIIKWLLLLCTSIPVVLFAVYLAVLLIDRIEDVHENGYPPPTRIECTTDG